MKKLLNKLGIYDFKSFKVVVFQMFKFGIVGAMNTFLYVIIYYPLVYFGVHYVLANIIAFVIGTLNSFYWNRNFVFKQTSGSKLKQLVKVFATYGFTAGLSTILIYLIVDIFGVSEYIAPLITFCFTTPTNFLLIKYWAFQTPKIKEVEK